MRYYLTHHDKRVAWMNDDGSWGASIPGIGDILNDQFPLTGGPDIPNPFLVTALKAASFIEAVVEEGETKFQPDESPTDKGIKY